MKSFDAERASENDSTKVDSAANQLASVTSASGASSRPRVLSRKAACACGGGCPRCQSEVAAKRRGSSQASPSSDSASSLVSDALGTPGEPLQQNVRRNFESSFQHDFSDVRVHRDERAAVSAEAVNANAYTVGRDIVFASGYYAPETGEGDRLIAHELTHVMQQRGGASNLSSHLHDEQASALRVSHPSDAAEQEADRVAQAVTQSGASQAASPTLQHSIDAGAVVQRQDKKEPEEGKKPEEEKKADAPAAPAPTPAAAPAAAPADDVLKWPDLLPSNSIEPINIKKSDPARYAKMQEICKQIKDYRQTIPIKNMPGKKYTVFDQSPNPDPSSSSPNFKDKSKEADDYRAWLKTAQTPEEQAKKSQNQPVDDELRIQLVIWRELLGDEKTPGEGDPSAMNYYDSEGITWGAGFSGKGQMQEMMYKHLFQKDKAGGPDVDNKSVKETFLRAGIDVVKNGSQYNFVVVDVNGLWKLPQSEGVKVIKADTHLLSLFVDVAQGIDVPPTQKAAAGGQPQPKAAPQSSAGGARQAVYNAQWEQFKSHAGNIHTFVDQLKGWKSNDALSFAGHIVHWGKAQWSELASTGGSAAALRNVVLPKLPKNKDGDVEGDAAASFLRFGHNLMKSVMAASPTRTPGKINVIADGKYYTPA